MDTFVQYEHRERALEAAALEAEIPIDSHGILENDLESKLFKPHRTADFEAEYMKWMKQQPVKRDTDILRY